ncbi:MAG: DegT/DnrJ/EryC1/StrS family aminotransferase [Bacteroidota bacterium]
MKVPFVDLLAQYRSIKNEIDTAMQMVIKSSAFIGGQYVKQFEDAFAAYCQAKYCVGVGNGTDSIYIALRALGIGQGDEVITVANSFIATSEAITMTGARVVFVDCEPQSYNIDCSKVPAAISPRTKAIVPVHLYGQPTDMNALNAIALEYNLCIVEDAAQAHGAEYNGCRVGTFGNAACFSFFPGKNLGAYGDGGAIVTNDESLADRCRMIANHGRLKKYDHEFEGVNSRLDGLQAAILSVKLKNLEEWTEKRRKAAEQYNGFLQEVGVITPYALDGVRHVYHLYVVRLQEREKVQQALSEAGIATGIHYPIALPNLRAYKYLGKTPADFPISTKYSKEILSLPMFPELQGRQIEYVSKHLIAAVNHR